jgi:prepilin-type N-terminal cleavage/methylation domain-containing protein
MQKKLNNKGFTIVEVLIVLAIAGAILAAVLIAVPALQRSGRNSTIKTAAQQLVSGINENEAANNGKVPFAVAGTGDITITNTVTTHTKVAGQVVVATGSAGNPVVNHITVVLNATCSTTPTASTGAATVTPVATSGSFGIIYPIEGASATTYACVQA